MIPPTNREGCNRGDKGRKRKKNEEMKKKWGEGELRFIDEKNEKKKSVTAKLPN